MIKRLLVVLLLFTLYFGIARASEEKPFVIIIASYNNSDWCERNLRSVFEQKYGNYRVIYIDDASTDDTLEKVTRFVKAAGQEGRFTLMHNETNRGAAENYYRVIHGCKDDEVVIICDGDDWFLHEWVLKRLNDEYANLEVWMTYGGYFYYPSFKKGDCAKRIPKKVIEKKMLHEHLKKKGFILSHLKTFYVGLFKQIKLEDLLFEGQFMQASWDAAAMVPLVEMAGLHAHFVKHPLYANNRANVLNDDRVRFNIQQKCWDYVKEKKPYEPLVHWKKEGESQADCVVFSYDRPLQLYALLESLEQHVKGVRQTTVLYRVSGTEFDEAYDDVVVAFPKIHFVKQGKDPKADFKPLLLKALHESPAQYVMFVVDDMVVKDEIDCAHAMEALEVTGAEGFFFRLGKHVTYSYANDADQGVPQGIAIEGGITAWQYSHGKGDWNYPHSVDMTLYKKSEFLPLFEKMRYAHPGKLEERWAGKPEYNRVGLCYDTSKVLNIPLNLVLDSKNRYVKSYSVEELLKTFEKGLKMDISPLYQMNNRSAHIEYEPTFIVR